MKLRFDPPEPVEMTGNDFAWFLVKVMLAFCLVVAFVIGWMSL